MGYLLTVGVAVFQLGILVSMILAAAFSRSARRICAIGWLVFTLVGGIFTWGLFLLQLFTIWIAWRLSARFLPSESATDARAPAVQADSPAHSAVPAGTIDAARKTATPTGRFFDLMAVLVGVVVAIAHGIGGLSTSPTPTFTPPAAVGPAPTASQVKPSRVGSSTARPVPSFQRRPGSTAADLRHCLELKDPAAVARCTESDAATPAVRASNGQSPRSGSGPSPGSTVPMKH